MSVHPPRTHTCGALRTDHIGERVTLKGWVDSTRNLGGLLFVDLRDRYGRTQIVFTPPGEAHAGAEELRFEDVISVQGEVRHRIEDQVNERLATGAIEVHVDSIEVLSTSETLPFPVTSHEVKQQLEAGEDLRLKHRYLDLRRPTLQRNLLLRHRTYQSIRRYFDENDFLEVETPVLMKSTPEGARDYLVPSRVHPGRFFALPQSPQTYKQLLMVAGMDRYFQIVKCFRDEDLRADRQPEFTQVDVEMAFASEEDVYELTEGMAKRLWKDALDTNIETPFPRISYDDAIRRFGSDKPDLRFDLELTDLSQAVHGSGFRLFDQTIDDGGAVVSMRVPGEGDRGRGAMDRLDKDVVRKKIGAGGLIYFRLPADGSETLSSVKDSVLPSSYVDRAVEATGASAGDLVLILVGPTPRVFQQMGTLRLHMANELGLIPEGNQGPWKFLWVTDFPLLEHDEGDARFYAMHHPFTSPHPEDLDKLDPDSEAYDPGNARARAYDLVLNGHEIGGGSIRIHQRETQQQMLGLLGIDAEEAQRRFGFLLEAFRYGAPPHGGIALGLDRMVMLLAGATALRDVIAFPKTQSATEPMSGAPDVVDQEQLDALHVRIVEADRKD